MVLRNRLFVSALALVVPLCAATRVLAQAGSVWDAAYVAVAKRDERSATLQVADAAGRVPAPLVTGEVKRPIELGAMIGEILTTARRRSEDLQSTPVAVSALGSAQLQGQQVRRMTDLDARVPNLEIDSAVGTANTARITLRGVGQGDVIESVDPAVGLYLDGVYVPRSQGALRSLYDIEQVEVLRGPQGTLFGKNTIGGAIQVTTRRPTLEREASAEVRIGSFDSLSTRFTLNLPLVPERAAARISLATDQDDGYEVNATTGRRLATQRRIAGRGQLLLLPSDDLEVLLSAELASEPSRPQGAKCKLTRDPRLSTVPRLRAATREACAQDAGRSEHRSASDLGDLRDELQSTALASQVVWDISPMISLRSISALREQRSRVVQDSDGGEVNSVAPLVSPEDESRQRSWSQELQLNGRVSDRLEWVGGLYAFGEQVNASSYAGSSSIGAAELGFPVLDQLRKIDNRTLAVYGQATLALTDRLSATFGLRRTLERKRVKRGDVTTGTARPLFAIQSERSARFDDFSPSAQLGYQWTEDVLTYVSYSRGFRSGGFNGRVNLFNDDTRRIEPERLTTYEVGAKSKLAEGRLLLNAAAFFSVYDEIQRTVPTIGRLGVPTVVVRNAAEARLRGAELEAIALPLPTLRLDATLSAFGSRYREFDFDSGSQSSAEQARLVGQPGVQASFGIEHQLLLGGAAEITTRVRWTHRGAQANDSLDSPSIRSDKHGLLDASATWVLADGRTEITLSGTNLLDRTYVSNGFDFTPAAGFALRFYGPPRRYGIAIRREF